MCEEAPGLVADKRRLLDVIGGSFLGIIGDANHSFGYHLCQPPAGDYSTAGAANAPAGPYSCAIDIGMDWPASRDWLHWLIAAIRDDRIRGVAEVIGSYDGSYVRYWSDSETPSWQDEGVPYQGQGHDTWTHVAVYRSTALQDHGLLAGWTANGLGDNIMSQQAENILAAYAAGLPTANGQPFVPVIDILGRQKWQASVDAQLKALAAAITALAAGGTSIDTKAVLAHIDQVAATESATVQALQERLAAGAQAAAAALRAM